VSRDMNNCPGGAKALCSERKIDGMRRRLADDHLDGLHDETPAAGCPSCAIEQAPRKPPETEAERHEREDHNREVLSARVREARLEVSIVCPKCNAHVGQACRRPAGIARTAVMSRAHKERRVAVGLTGKPR
jgi:hypothetical protein